MADVVIVVGARRGGEPVPAAEIKQMVGRAGRRHGGTACEAVVLVDGQDEARIDGGLRGDDKFEVSSAMTTCDELVFHLVPEICSGNVQDLDEARKWYSRSFGAYGGARPDVGKALESLRRCGAVEDAPLGLIPTETARISAELYFHPFDVSAWKANFEKLFDLGLERSDAAVAWALGSVPKAEAPGDLGDRRYVFGQFKDALPSELESEPGTVAKSVLWWSALGCASLGKMRNRMLAMRRDFGRVGRALERLDKSEDWGMSSFFKELGARMRRGVPEHLSKLFGIQGMSKGLASYLHEAGVEDREGLAEALPGLEDDLDEGTLSFLRRVAGDSRQGF